MKLPPQRLLLVKRSLERFFYSAGTNIALYNAVQSDKGQQFQNKITQTINKQINHVATLDTISRSISHSNIKKQNDSFIEHEIATSWLPFLQAFDGGSLALLALLVWAAGQGGQAGLDKMVPDHRFTLTNLELKEKLNLRADYLPDALDKTGITWVSRTVSEAVAQGMKPTEIVKYLREKAKEISSERGQLIVETELMTAMNLAEIETFRRNGIEKVVWKTADDERVESLCLANEAAGAINIGEEFPMGQVSPPGHIRCRCYLLPVLPQSIEGVVWSGS